jgi:hypothetical protein
MGGSKSTTKVEPSPLDVVRADLAKQLAPAIQQIVMGGLLGTPTTGQVRGANLASQQLKSTAGSMGIAPGSPILAKGQQNIMESLTKPNADMLSMAVQLFSGAPSLGGKTTTTQSAGALGGLSSLLGLIAPLALAGGPMGLGLFGGAGGGTTALGGTSMPYSGLW